MPTPTPQTEPARHVPSSPGRAGFGVSEERPLCKCHGEPMFRAGTYGAGKQRWRCRLTASSPAAWKRKNPEKVRVHRRRHYLAHAEEERARNAQQIRSCGMYLGRVGFTEREVKEMVNGTPH